jgi:methanogenic corrinoid protein MtbC1
MSVSDTLFESYLQHLLDGNKHACLQIVDDLRIQQIPIETIYSALFQRSLYKVGEYWEMNIISVATEHMATAITEQMMIRLQPDLFSTDRIGKKAVIACVANEHHQIGAKMIADIFEMNGWDGYFIGANTPADELLRFIESQHPDIVGLSLSIYFNMPLFTKSLDLIKSAFPEMPVIIGGQAFRWGGSGIVNHYKDTTFIASLPSLQQFISEKSSL